MSSLVDAVEKAIGSPEAVQQAQEYVKTVEAWESGRNIPMGPASRVLDLLSEDKTVADRFVMSTPLEEITVHN